MIAAVIPCHQSFGPSELEIRVETLAEAVIVIAVKGKPDLTCVLLHEKVCIGAAS
jgi:hypothetical protein